MKHFIAVRPVCYRILNEIRSRETVSHSNPPCRWLQGGLIDDRFGETKEDCPNCKDDWNVLCRVSNHSSRQQGKFVDIL